MRATLDCLHGEERTIAVYLVDTADGPALVDTGPASTIGNLRAALAVHGLALADLRHLLVTHIHFDHAGAAGFIVREAPDCLVHVSEIGAPHLVDPSRLEASARRIYGEAFDTLWGALAPVPEANVRVTGERVLGMECFPTPGHARHHVSFLDADGTLYAGDVAGIRIQPERYIRPAVPPPDVDLEAFRASWDEIERRGPARLALAHFGVEEDVADHLARCRAEHERWAALVRDGMGRDEFVAAAAADYREQGEGAAYYELASSSASGWDGLRRYWDKRKEAGR